MSNSGDMGLEDHEPLRASHDEEPSRQAQSMPVRAKLLLFTLKVACTAVLLSILAYPLVIISITMGWLTNEATIKFVKAFVAAGIYYSNETAAVSFISACAIGVSVLVVKLWSLDDQWLHHDYFRFTVAGLGMISFLALFAKLVFEVTGASIEMALRV